MEALMSKLGVGVGEDFPLDEEKTRQAGEESPCCGSEWHRQRAQGREAWRRMREQMRAEWRARRHAMHQRFAERDPIEPIASAEAHSRHMHHLAVGALALIGLAALLGHHRK
jgi:hypothetical protein